MKRIALFGAGAEVDLGFSTGNNFTRDTFYRNKTLLYDSLREFYADRLNYNRTLVPDGYSAAFILQPTGAAFKALVENITKQEPQFVKRVLELPSLDADSSLTSELLNKLYKKLIVESDATDDVWRQSSLLDCLPADMHFGILEQYYSELINPREHPIRFWKLINFYWSAFFSIVLPICDKIYGGRIEYGKNRYAFILGQLNEIVERIYRFEQSDYSNLNNSYYGILRGKFDGVITTNYTPYSTYVVDGDESRLARLSGSLSSFEDLRTLSVFDARERSIGNSEFIFPYLMCQSPVKPIIDSSQLEEYSKAIGMLAEADELVVLGYSFCREDSHVANIVSTALRKNDNLNLSYCHYDVNADVYMESERQKVAKEYKSVLMNNIRFRGAERISVHLVSSYRQLRV